MASNMPPGVREMDDPALAGIAPAGYDPFTQEWKDVPIGEEPHLLSDIYQVDTDLITMKKRIKALEEKRSQLVERAEKQGILAEGDRCGNSYTLVAVPRTVRTLDQTKLFQKFPLVFEKIATAIWTVSIKDAEKHLGENDISDCSTLKTTVSYKVKYELGDKTPAEVL